MAKNDDNQNDNKNNQNSKDNSMTTAEAGRMGGEKVSKERGPEFYSEIGQKQGKENNPGNFANRDKEDVQEAGRRGGERRGQQQQEGDDNNNDDNNQ
jgi:general stress protein YciG